MASATFPTRPAPKEQLHTIPDFPPTKKDSKTAHSAPDSNRRHSLPSHFLPTSLWSKNASSASLVESEEAARGEHIFDQSSVANRISALRQLNGATRSGHRYAKSTGARNSTFSQPVIVRTYSGTIRPRSQHRDIITVKKENGMAARSTNKVDLKLPPVEAFSFKGIMDEIRHGVTEDLERIAEICARSKYSLSNQYEVHMPPHGRGEPIIQTGTLGSSTNGPGPTLQAIGSDDETPRYQRARGVRKARSAAYGTLETIMSSSRSSDEDKTRKKPAAEIAEEVRGRAAMMALSSKDVEECVVENDLGPRRPAKHVRSKSASFASMMLDTAHSFNSDAGSQMVSSTSLISEPARPQTSTASDLKNVPTFRNQLPVSTPIRTSSTKPEMIRNLSSASTLRPGVGTLPTIFENLNSWLPWTKRPEKSVSHAEGSLRNLLKSSEPDRKGKGVDRSGSTSRGDIYRSYRQPDK